MSAPLPTDVTPRTKPSSAPRPTAAARVPEVSGTAWRSRAVCARMKSARPSVTTAVTARAAATPHSRPVPCRPGTRSTTTTPATEAGTLPTASHVETPTSTVPLRRWRHPPSVFVIAP